MTTMERIEVGTGDALLIIDMQRDFMPGGALPVAGADALLSVINACMRRFEGKGLPIFATRDWHPDDHSSFVTEGGSWPVHCVADSDGARFAEGLELPQDVHTINKGKQCALPGYSAFEATALHMQLQAQGVHCLFVAGVATEYCVLASVLDALELGYAVVLLGDGVRAVSAQDGAQALHDMQQRGAVIMQQELLA